LTEFLNIIDGSSSLKNYSLDSEVLNSTELRIIEYY